MQKFSRGKSTPPNGWPQQQLEDAELWLATRPHINVGTIGHVDHAEHPLTKALERVRATADQSGVKRKELQFAVYKMLYCTDFDQLCEETVNNQ